jgi:membrane fusion protein (multidrug efflux system)
MNKKKLMQRMLIMIMLLAMLFALIFGYKIYSSIAFGKIMARKIPIVTVSTMKADYSNWQPELNIIGTLRSVNGVDVTTEIGGLVKEIYFKSGESIEANTPLLQLDISTDVARLASLEANAELAKTNYKRDKAQFAIQAISKAVLDVDAANVKTTKAQVDEQTALIAKKTITTPFFGRLGISLVNPGQYINPGDKIVTLQQLNPIYIDFYLPQQDLINIKTGQEIKAKIDTFKDKVFTGEITTIEPIVDSNTRNIAVEVTMNNPDFLLLPGMFASISIKIQEPKKYITLPQSAVSFNPYGDLVYIIKKSGIDKQGKEILKATQSFIVIDDKRGDQVAISSGLQAGDEVVTSGQLKLKNGSIVKINNTIMPANNPNPQVINKS